MQNFFMLPSNTRNSEEVISMRMYEHAAGYGVYIMILELMRDSPNYAINPNPARIAFAINEPDVDIVERVLTKYNLFESTEDGLITSPWLHTIMQCYEEKKSASREAASKAAAARWAKRSAEDKKHMQEQCASNADALQEQCTSNANTLQDNATNNINNIKQNNNTNQPCARDLYWSVEGVGKISSEKIKAVCRDNSARYTIAMICKDNIGRSKEYNPNICSDAAILLGLTYEQYKFLVYITLNGKVGHPCTKAAIVATNAVRNGEIYPTFPMNYILSKMPNYDRIYAH